MYACIHSYSWSKQCLTHCGVKSLENMHTRTYDTKALTRSFNSLRVGDRHGLQNV